LYSSEDALAVIYKTDSLEAACAEQARTAAQLNAIQAEDLRKTRIPIEIVLQVNDVRADEKLTAFLDSNLRFARAGELNMHGRSRRR
jgi:hypothetical protein